MYTHHSLWMTQILCKGVIIVLFYAFVTVSMTGTKKTRILISHVRRTIYFQIHSLAFVSAVDIPTKASAMASPAAVSAVSAPS
jgi:hypothetical protein